ncbi:helix-turn-helix transcriptional regulator [Ramlibacter sp.]|uniref:helix-turn-helix domain-containing protein n=1 Tax=Ramlibacter sp. TaxID=1917967 RepID=UPI00262AE554|nr:helix-turn-helix transcriptional regulator [Ramlibacter sp.]
MTDLAHSLKTEISRVARKEIRSELADLKRANSQHRAHIAALRRQVEGMERALMQVSKAQRNVDGSSASSGSAEPAALRFRASGLASHRKRLGLSAADFGKLIGVSGQSVYKWETGEVKPRRAQLELIAAIRKIGRREAVARLASAQ